jgi:lipid-A-disaccharide synthase
MQHMAWVAGEPSGDMLGAHVLSGLRARHSGLRAVGIGGPHLAKAGLDAWWPSEKLAVRGYVEVLRHYREIVGIRKQLAERLLADPPQVFVGVDAPDFNLDLELKLRQAGVKTVHFISPSIWAWRPERIEKIRAACDEVLCIFPFEPAIYERAGMRASYVGHPLASVIPAEPPVAQAKAALGLPLDVPVLAVLPGSRGAEVAYIAQRQFEAVALLLKQFADLRVVVPCVPSLMLRIEAAARAAGLGAELGKRVTLLQGQSHAALAACTVTLIASGTATLEAALFQKPMVIVYNMHPVSWWLTERKRMQPWVGLPNILCEHFVVPELLQRDATPQRMAKAVADWLQDAPLRERAAQRFAHLHAALKRDTVGLACSAIEDVCSR